MKYSDDSQNVCDNDLINNMSNLDCSVGKQNHKNNSQNVISPKINKRNKKKERKKQNISGNNEVGKELENSKPNKDDEKATFGIVWNCGLEFTWS